MGLVRSLRVRFVDSLSDHQREVVSKCFSCIGDVYYMNGLDEGCTDVRGRVFESDVRKMGVHGISLTLT